MYIDGIKRYSYDDILEEVLPELSVGAKIKLKSIDPRRADPERKVTSESADYYIYNDWKVVEVYRYHFVVERNVRKNTICKGVNIKDYWQRRTETIV